MKTKEEIEYAAANLANPNVCKTTNWIEGYTQCQEDMADKKYTEEDMLKAFEKGALYGSTKNGNIHYFDEIINSLNKQD